MRWLSELVRGIRYGYRRAVARHKARMALEPCCRSQSNRYLTNESARPDLKIYRCKVCQRRHFHAKADPGRFVAAGSSLGA